MSEKFTAVSVVRTANKVRVMSGVAKASALLDELAMPWPPRSNFKDAITRVTKAVNTVARRAGILNEPIKHSRIEDLWRKEARRIDAEEMDAIRAAVVAAKAGSLVDQLQALESTLALVDPEYFGPALQVLREASRQHRGDAREMGGERRPLASSAGA
ncbi:hypothetical protein ACO2RV_17010 [Ancylobacter sp. VNQ12]|uniref:hypothetical protein n=1 Tax=Ancylobacter sp. VNQ12 TaxID=3400920 RepID=UPI003C0D9A91